MVEYDKIHNNVLGEKGVAHQHQTLTPPRSTVKAVSWFRLAGAGCLAVIYGKMNLKLHQEISQLPDLKISRE